MDDIDQQLLSELRRDARASMVDLAKRIGLSRSATQDRMARLERDGAIAGYTIREPDGVARQSAHVFLKLANGATCAIAAPALRAIPGVAEIYSVAGDLDLIVRLETRDMAAIERALSSFLDIRAVSVVSTSITLKRF
jgi:Lrp/AsnC family transcriptional regulator, leucine-responsive regulatory protein